MRRIAIVSEHASPTSFLVPPEDPDALAGKLAQLEADPALCASMGLAGRQRAYRHYTWKRVAAKVDAIYRGALGASNDEPAAIAADAQ